MARSIARWAVGALVLWAGKGVVMVAAPIVSLPLFVVHREESETTGFPSLHPGQPREFLVRPLRWMQTHDAPLDEWRYESYSDGSRWKNNKYLARVIWLWRNPAYGLAEALGFDQTGIEPISEHDDGTWRKPITDYQYWTARNERGQWGFMLRGQIRLWGRTYMEYRLGYGLYRESPKRGRGMLYARLFKFRRYHE